MGRRTVLLVSSVLVAAFGVVLIGLYVRGADRRAQGEVALVEVAVTNAPIPAGMSAEGARPAVKAVLRPRSALPSGALSQTAWQSVTGEAVTTIPENTILSGSLFRDSTQAADVRPTGKNVFTSISVPDQDRVPGMVTPGSVVTVFSTTADASVPVLKHIKVVKVGAAGAGETNAPSSDSANIPDSILVLEVSIDQSSTLLKAEKRGGLSVSLESPPAKQANTLAGGSS